MDLRTKINRKMFVKKQFLLNLYSKFKRFLYKNIVSIYIITVLLIVLLMNIFMRNQRIFELETKVKELEFEKNYINTIENTVENTVDDTVKQ